MRVSMISCRPGRFRAALGAICLWISLTAPALAQDAPAVPRSCDDAFADIYFMPNAQDYPAGLPPGMTQGLPEPHLHLPRALLQIGIGRDEAHYGQAINIAPRRFCDRTAFAALNAFYVSTKDLAHRLGLAYDPPSPNGDQLIVTVAPKKMPIDDSADREAMAGRGTWVLSEGAALFYEFCLSPVLSSPSIHESCYAIADNLHMGYTTNGIQFQTQPFFFTTFKKDSTNPRKYITAEDLDRYFSFMRSLVSTVLITTSSN